MGAIWVDYLLQGSLRQAGGLNHPSRRCLDDGIIVSVSGSPRLSKIEKLDDGLGSKNKRDEFVLGQGSTAQYGWMAPSPPTPLVERPQPVTVHIVHDYQTIGTDWRRKPINTAFRTTRTLRDEMTACHPSIYNVLENLENLEIFKLLPQWWPCLGLWVLSIEAAASGGSSNSVTQPPAHFKCERYQWLHQALVCAQVTLQREVPDARYRA